MQEQAKDYFHTLYEVVKDVNSSLDPKTVIKKVAEKVSWAMDVKASSIRLLSNNKSYLLAGASYGLSQSYLRKGKIEVAKSGLDQEVLQGQNVYVCDACADNRFQYPEAAKEEGITSVMAVPLKLLGQEVIGVLRVYSSARREFSQEEIEFLNAMADLSAMAINNAIAYDNIKYEHELLNRYTYQLFED
ncbi:MAG TPA: GAF domain-containing protein [Desulfohalobiaceae bacterium]|nr:GAF domain-containing protein [Desulfohalobiaceae bacterium]